MKGKLLELAQLGPLFRLALGTINELGQLHAVKLLWSGLVLFTEVQSGCVNERCEQESLCATQHSRGARACGDEAGSGEGNGTGTGRELVGSVIGAHVH